MAQCVGGFQCFHDEELHWNNRDRSLGLFLLDSNHPFSVSQPWVPCKGAAFRSVCAKFTLWGYKRFYLRWLKWHWEFWAALNKDGGEGTSASAEEPSAQFSWSLRHWPKQAGIGKLVWDQRNSKQSHNKSEKGLCPGQLWVYRSQDSRECSELFWTQMLLC